MLRQILSEASVKAVRELLEQSEHIVITCHVAPDGDAIGSSLGLLHALANIGKEARIVTPDRTPENIRFLPGVKDIVPYSMYPDFARQLMTEADLIFCLDYNALYRIDRLQELMEVATAKKILVDHHENPADFADVIISHPEQSSTSVLIFRLLCRLELFSAIDRKSATCIYTGMMTDTGNFSYNSNDPDLYVVVAELIKKGIDKDEIYKKVMHNKRPSVLKLNGYALCNMQYFPESKAALIVLTTKDLQRFEHQKGDTEGLVNEPLTVRDIIYSVFIREGERYQKVSTRSKGGLKVNKICEKYFNGGGHVNAAGGEFYGSLDEAVETFKKSLEYVNQYIEKREKKKQENNKILN